MERSNVIHAQSQLTHPCRVLYTGRSGMGKTYHAVQLFLDVFQDVIKRLIVVCPSFYIQPCMRALDPFVRNGLDVITEPDSDTFNRIKKDIIKTNQRCVNNGKPSIPTMVFIDDLSGLSVIHGGRISAFASFAIQTRPLGVSCILVTQQATSVTPAFRDNVNAVIAFPAQRLKEKEWLISEYGGSLSKKKMEDVVDLAWNGPNRDDDAEWGQHFLFINAPARRPLEYYGDFTHELHVPKRSDA